MYSEKLENLISLALVDGILTEKERQVLIKNAEAEGIDLDEFCIYLDARLLREQQRQQKQQQMENPDKSKGNFISSIPLLWKILLCIGIGVGIACFFVIKYLLPWIIIILVVVVGIILFFKFSNKSFNDFFK
jgi:Flp pilus assembly protein TadB